MNSARESDREAGKDFAGDMGWQATVLTILPEMFPGPLGQSLSGRALQAGIWSLETVDIRGFARDKHRSVDDTPAGGGPGMVMRADILGTAIDAVCGSGAVDRPLIYPSPRGVPFTQDIARALSAAPGAIFLCGRFEGVDQRLLDARPIREVSLGDYVLSGGEMGAMVMIDAAVRLLHGVMGAHQSADEESFEGGLLEYPHYTRPQIWENRAIPDILQSGHHGRIRDWRREEAERATKHRRPDLWKRYCAQTR